VLVDGHKLTVQSSATTVAEALAEAGIALGPKDVATPALGTTLTGVPTVIQVDRSLPVRVMDGGYLVAAGEVPAGKPEGVLQSLNVPLGPADKVTASMPSITDNFVGQIVTVTRGVSTAFESVPAPTQTVSDGNLNVGTSQARQQGINGQQQVTFRLVYIPGQGYTRQVLASLVTLAPVPTIVANGTKVVAKPTPVVTPPPSSDEARSLGYKMMAERWGASEWGCLDQLWTHESGWRTTAGNSSGAYGIPQSYPGSKMASAGSDYLTNPSTQIAWGLSYIGSKYGSPCQAWSHWQAVRSY
jgi:hypothetical protein